MFSNSDELGHVGTLFHSSPGPTLSKRSVNGHFLFPFRLQYAYLKVGRMLEAAILLIRESRFTTSKLSILILSQRLFTEKQQQAASALSDIELQTRVLPLKTVILEISRRARSRKIELFLQYL